MDHGLLGESRYDNSSLVQQKRWKSPQIFWEDPGEWSMDDLPCERNLPLNTFFRREARLFREAHPVLEKIMEESLRQCRFCGKDANLGPLNHGFHRFLCGFEFGKTIMCCRL